MLSLRVRKALLAAAVAVALPVTAAIITVPGGASAAVALAPPPKSPTPTPTPTQTVVCPPDNGGNNPCHGSVGNPGGPAPSSPGSTGGGGGGGQVCTHNGAVVACFDPAWGYYDTFNDCYYLFDSPQPPTGDPSRQGHPAGDGNVYIRTCLGPSGPGGPANNQVLVWLPDPPPGQPGAPTDAVRAQHALGQFNIMGPDIGITPKPDGPGGIGNIGLVGLPTWLWTKLAPGTWNPPPPLVLNITGLTLTLTADQAVSISWDMGSGFTVVCTNPGVPYDPAAGPKMSPSCGFRYLKPGDYTVTGTTTWTVRWTASDGASGVINNVQRSSSVIIHIRQLEVVTQ